MPKTTRSIAIDDEWQADSDMRTLVEARKIMKDKKRLANARKAAKKKLTEMQAAVKALEE